MKITLPITKKNNNYKITQNLFGGVSANSIQENIGTSIDIPNNLTDIQKQNVIDAFNKLIDRLAIYCEA